MSKNKDLECNDLVTMNDLCVVLFLILLALFVCVVILGQIIDNSKKEIIESQKTCVCACDKSK